MKIQLFARFADINRAEALENWSGFLTDFYVVLSLGALSIFGHLHAVVVVFCCFSLLFLLLQRHSGVNARQFRDAERLDALRYRGLYFEAGQGTDENVRALRDAGYRGYAIALYRQLHPNAGSRAARAMDAL